MRARSAFMLVLAVLVSGMVLPAVAQSPGQPPVTVRGIHPAAPRPFELVNLRLSMHYCDMWPGPVRVRQVPVAIQVTVERGEPGICGVPQSDGYIDLDVRLGAFPVGSYAVDVIPGTGPAPTVAPQRLAFEVVEPPEIQVFPPPPAPHTDYSGAWWNPGESGWGLSITQRASNQMFVAVYVYDAAGRPEWFVAPGGSWEAGGTWKGTLYRTSGPPRSAWFPPGASFNPDAVTRTPVGTLEFRAWQPWHTFASPRFGEAMVVMEIDGATVFRTIRRMEY